jgi:superfamily II DNA or RNA helicase
MSRPELRFYQRDVKAATYAAWNRYGKPSNIGAVAATGSGKTVLFCDMLQDYGGVRGALVHRQELVGQISVTMARYGLQHRIIAPDAVIRRIVSMQINETGASYHDPRGRAFVAGVDTFNNLPDEAWMKQCGLAVPDEAHHVLRENKWGRALARLPNAYGFFPTATPSRADGKGLGRHADGLIDELVMAPEMREIIDMGYLTDYQLVLAESDVQMSDADISASTGDFNADKLRKAHHASKKIVGDVVKTYLMYARGKLGVTFAVDVEEATKIAQGFRDAGVPAEVVSAKTPDDLRAAIIARFKRREILQLVNVDLFGEGFDLPAIEVVSFARHTNSFALYTQQFGRALRLMLESHLIAAWESYTPEQRKQLIRQSKKPRAIVIDHVGNIMRHKGPPDALWRKGKWTLDRREARGASKDNDAEPLVQCLSPHGLIELPTAQHSVAELAAHGYSTEQIVAAGAAMYSGVPCANAYERWRVRCPHCGFKPEPAGRSTPEQVDGNMLLVDEAYMEALRLGVAAKLEGGPKIPWNAAPAVAGRLHKVHDEHKAAIYALKNAAAWWSGLCTQQGLSDAEAHKRFYAKFGVDVFTMQTLDRAPALDLHGRVISELAKHGVDGTVNAGVGLPELN